MEIGLFYEGKEYISAKRAAAKMGYASDYIGQLCRAKKIPGKLVGKTWYVDLDFLNDYKSHQKSGRPRKVAGGSDVTSSSAEKISLGMFERRDVPAPLPKEKPLFDYAFDEGHRLPVLAKSLPRKSSFKTSRFVGEAIVVAMALIFCISSTGLIAKDMIPASFVARFESFDERVSGMAMHLVPETDELVALSLAAGDEAENVFMKIVSAFERLKRIAFGKLFLGSSNEIAGADRTGASTVAVVSISEPLAISTLRQELLGEVEKYIASLNVSSSAPLSVNNYYPTTYITVPGSVAGPAVYNIVTNQSTADADRISRHLSGILNGGTFTGATISGGTATFEEFCLTGDTCISAWPTGGGIGFSTTSANYWLENEGLVASFNAIFGNSTTTNATSTTFFADLGNFSELCIDGVCRTTWPSGGGGGSIGTSTTPTAGELAIWTDVDTLGSVATSSLNINTNNLVEGANLFFTDTRVQTYLDALAKGYFFSTTSAEHFLSLNQNLAFSTTSASFFLSQNLGLAFSTTSADYWETLQTRWATTSAMYFLSQNQGNAFSTTSASYFLENNQGLAFSTTSAQYFINDEGLLSLTDLDGISKGYFFSTTSADYYLSLNQGNAFSTTSVDYWESTQNRWSTSSAQYFLENNQGLAFSTTSSDFWISLYDKGFFFSTTSALAFLEENINLAWSTTSADYWETEQTRWATTSAAYFLSQNQGNAFSTTSADYYLENDGLLAGYDAIFGNSTTTNATSSTFFATLGSFDTICFTGGTCETDWPAGYTDGDVQTYLDTINKGYFFSTTSATNFLSLNQGLAFSTTSATNFLSLNQGLAFSTTSALNFLALNQGLAFSTTSADYWETQQTRYGTSDFQTDLAAGYDAIFGNSTTTNSTSTTTFSGTASSTNLFSTNFNLGTGSIGSLNTSALSLGSLTGILEANNGVVSSSSTLSVAYGGTGAGSFGNNRLITGNGTGALTDEANLTFDGTTLTVDSKIRVDSAGDTGFEFYESGTYRWTASYSVAGDYFYFRDIQNMRDHLVMYENGDTIFPAIAGNVGIGTSDPQATLDVLGTASSTNLLVQGNSTTTNATTTGTTYAGRLGLNSEYFSDLTGTGLTNTGGVLTLDATGDWTGTLDGQEGSYYLANSFSTTSASYFLSQNQGAAFSTTSALAHLDTLNKGYFFSTTSATNFLSLNQGLAFSTTSANHWSALGLGFSTTSANHWLTLNQGNAFSTTSADYWETEQTRWATTSASYFLSQNQGAAFSTTSADYYLENDGLLAGYDAIFGNSTTTNSTSTTFYSSTLTAGNATTTNLFSNLGQFDALFANTANLSESGNLFFTNARVQTYLDNLNKGYFFSTTSADYYLSLNQDNAFSTTSASYFLSQNQGNAFSTTSADYWETVQTRYGTSDFQNDLLAGYDAIFGDATTTNATSTTFFSSILTAGNATTTNFFATIASSTNLFALDGVIGDDLRVSDDLILSSLLNCNSSSQALQSDGSGVVSCGTITGGGASAGGGWTSVAPNIVRLSTTTDMVGIGVTSPTAKLDISSGNAATTTLSLSPVLGQTANILEIYDTSLSLDSVISANGYLGLGTDTPTERLTVDGNLLLSGNSTTTHSTSTSLYSSTLTAGNATSTSLYTTTLGLNSEYFTDLTGTGLTNTGGILTLDATGDWTGTLDGQEGSYYLANSFSTTSASYFLSQNQGAAFSTTSALYHLSTIDKGYFFSTTSATNFLSLNQGLAFSTTSANHWSALGLGFSTTSAQYFVHSSTTIPKTYTANTFTALQTLSSGLLSTASSTIGGGTQTTGLTIAGGATTTGNAYFAGNVGVGNVNPIYPIDIQVNQNGPTIAQIANTTNGTLSSVNLVLVSNGGYASLGVQAPSFTGGGSLGHFADRLGLSTGGNLGGIDFAAIGANEDIRFFAGGSTTGHERLRITSAGLVGIGTDTPTERLTVDGNLLLSGNSTTTNATTTGTTYAGRLGLNSEYFTDLTGTGLTNTGGVLTLNTSGDWTGTLDGQEGSYYLANSFSTTSASYFLSQNQGAAFSTTSALYHLSTIDKGYFFSTTSALAHLDTLNKGYFFSTTSANHWSSLGLGFSTTSANHWLTLNQGNAFSTTSADYWETEQTRWATTSASYFLSQNQGAAFSTTSADYWLENDGLIAGYDAIFGNATITSATSTSFFSTSGSFDDILVSSGGVLNFDNGDATITHSNNTLSFDGAVVVFDSQIIPKFNNSTPLGADTFGWSDLFLGDGGTIDWNNGNVILTHSAGNLTLSSGDRFNASDAIFTRATTTQATTTSLAITGITNGLLSTNANGSVVATTSIGTNYITGLLGTINGTTFNRGGSITITAASSTLLANNNTWTGTNTFTGSNAYGTPSSITLTNATGLPVSTGITGLGTGVAAALGVNVGTAGSFVVNGGALGTPSSGTLTNATGLPIVNGTTGTLTVDRGGTGATTFTDNRILTGNGTSAINDEANLTFDGSLLTVTGTGRASTALQVGTGGSYESPLHVNMQDVPGSPNASSLLTIEHNSQDVALSIYNNSSYDGAIYFGRNGTTDAGRIVYDHGTDSLLLGANSSANQLFLSSNGNIGIGNTSPSQKLNVQGVIAGQALYATSTAMTSLLSGGLEVTGTTTLSQATSTSFYTTTLGLNSEYFTDLTGSGLTNTAGVLTLNTSGDWTGTFDGQEGTWYRDNSFSTTSALAHLETLNKGYFFSTTSANHWSALGLGFSTTSASYFLSQNQGNAFSTTSADYWLENDGIIAGYNAIFGNLQATASSTIGDGTATGGLTVSGNSTTTGNAYFAGNVGVGTNSPLAKLHVLNPDILGLDMVTNGDFAGDASGWTLPSGWTYGSGKISLDGTFHSWALQDVGAVAGRTYYVTFDLEDYVSGGLIVELGGGSELPPFTANGSYSGYITAAGTAELALGSYSGSPFEGSVDNITVQEVVDVMIAGNNSFPDAFRVTGSGDALFGGKVGIGGLNPSSMLHIEHDSADATFGLTIKNEDTEDTTLAGIGFESDTATGFLGAASSLFDGGTAVGNALGSLAGRTSLISFEGGGLDLMSVMGDIRFYTGVFQEGMRLDSTGNLGIGTTTPGARLHTLSTTEQLRLGYDQSNYSSLTVSSEGNLTIAPTGGTTNITGNLLVSGNSTTTNATTTALFSTKGTFTNLCLTGDNCITSWPTGGAFSTTSALYFLAQNQGLAFSSTSALYFLAQNQGNAFSTTSANYWKTQNNFFSTTSADYYLENDGLLAGYNAVFGNLRATASSTIGGGTASSGLTVSGNSTTTGLAYFVGSVGIGIDPSNLDPTGELHVNNEGDSSYIHIGRNAAGADLTNGDLIGELQFVGKFGGNVNDVATIGAFYEGDGTTRSGSLVFSTSNNGSGSDRLVITSDGLVGIGTEDPDELLHVSGSLEDGVNINLENLSGSSWKSQIAFFNSSDELWSLGVDQEGDMEDRFSIWSDTLGDYALVIDSAGRIGLGEDTPTERLHVDGNLLVEGNSTTTNSTSTNFFATTGRFTNLCLTGDNCITSWPTGGAFSTTSALYFLAQNQGLAFSSTSALYFLAQNQGNAFSTTSADYWLENDGLLGGYNATFGDSVLFGNALTHAGDTDTQILFTSDQVAFNIGGSTALTLNEAGSDIATFGSGWEVRMGSLFANASSTIGGGTGTTGLTIFGNSTTTGNAYFAGNVGIGTNAPTEALVIRNDQDGFTEAVINNQTNGAGAGSSLTLVASGGTGWIDIKSPSYTGGGSLAHFADRLALETANTLTGIDIVAGAATGDIRFYTGGDTTGHERMRLTNNGLTIFGNSTTTNATTTNFFAQTASTTSLYLATGAGCLEVGSNGLVESSGSACGSGGGASIGGDVTGGTTGSVLFVDSSGDLAQDNNNFFWDNSAKRLGLGTAASPDSVLHITGSVTTSGSAAVAGMLSELSMSNSTASGFQFGHRTVATISGSSQAATHVGDFIRMVDNTALANTVRGLEVQAWNGSNTSGVNTGIATFGKTFGLHAETDALAGGVSTPAAVFAELSGTQGNAIRAYSASITSSDLVSIFQTNSTFTGTALDFNLASGGGTFTGNTFRVRNGGTEYAHMNATGTLFLSMRSTGTSAVCHATNGAVTNDEITDCSGSVAADYAELYPVETGTDYGHLVSLGVEDVLTTEGNYVKRMVKSGKAYDGTVVGIVSNNWGDFSSTGYVFKEGDNAMPVALAGRVPVKANETNGPIKLGDYVTASGVAGEAMKATEPGVAIGIALEDFNPETGEVLVFVRNGWYAGSFDAASSTTASNENEGQGIIPAVFGAIVNAFESVFQIVFEQGILRVANIFSDRVVAKDELCIEDVCVDKETLQALLLNAGLNPTTPSGPTEPEETPEEPSEPEVPEENPEEPTEETPAEETPVEETLEEEGIGEETAPESEEGSEEAGEQTSGDEGGAVDNGSGESSDAGAESEGSEE